jgi:hypothetical protein
VTHGQSGTAVVRIVALTDKVPVNRYVDRGAAGKTCGRSWNTLISGQIGHHCKESVMRTKLTYFTALFGATAAAVAILAAPAAAAAVGKSCAAGESATVCQSPGNAQINDTTPPVHFDPYGGYGLALGGGGILPGR